MQESISHDLKIKFVSTSPSGGSKGLDQYMKMRKRQEKTTFGTAFNTVEPSEYSEGGRMNTGCFFSNDTVREDLAPPVLNLKTCTMGQIKGIYMRFCMLSVHF